MRIEQIQYFVEAANVGSISLAAQNLFISQQGLSNALQQLEQDIGFPLLTRQARGVSLTNNGKKFYQYACAFLGEYDKMMAFSKSAALQYSNNAEEIFLMATPMIMSMLSELIYSQEMLHQFFPKIRLYEGDLAKIISSLAEAKIQLGIFFIHKEFFAKFRESIPQNIELLVLFEDQPCVVVAENSPLAAEKIIDYNKAAGLKIAFSSSYQDYFKYATIAEPDIYSNDISLHKKLIEQQKALSLSTYKTFPYTYKNVAVVARQIADNSSGKYYLARNTDLVNQGTIEWISYIHDNICPT